MERLCSMPFDFCVHRCVGLAFSRSSLERPLSVFYAQQAEPQPRSLEDGGLVVLVVFVVLVVLVVGCRSLQFCGVAGDVFALLSLAVGQLAEDVGLTREFRLGANRV